MKRIKSNIKSFIKCIKPGASTKETKKLRKSIRELLHHQNCLLHLSNKKDYTLNFNINDIEIYMKLPDAHIDEIQKKILCNNTFYESDILFKLNEYIKIKGKNVIDIGANIGNHTIFFHKFLGAKTIYAFEPNIYCFELLEKNISLNEINNSYLHNVALASNNIYLKYSNYDPKNLGASSFKTTKNGDVVTRSLDSYEIKNVGLIKIDVEGMSNDVLLGSKKTIEESEPYLLIEIHKTEQKNTFKTLEKMNYRLAIKFKGNNYLFYTPDNI